MDALKEKQVEFLSEKYEALRANGKTHDQIRGALFIENDLGPCPFGDHSLNQVTAQFLKTVKPPAFHGPAGKIIRALEPHTEADPVGILLQFLSAFGNAIGDGPHVRVEADRHPAKLYCVLVGDTSTARKGTSAGHVRNIFRLIDPNWESENIKGGLSSGEGLIYHVRDADETSPEKDRDFGVSDKRLLIFEPEFATVLKNFARQGNTLSSVLRQAWDNGPLAILTKNCPTKTLSSHISLVSHITREELTRLLTETEMANGLGNRFLWASVRRSKLLPDGGAVSMETLPIEALKSALEKGRYLGEIKRTDSMSALWRQVYPRLTSGGVGLVGSLLARGAAQVLRISLIYALLDESDVIDKPHLEAALAVWEYCEESVRGIFGTSLGNTVADTLYRSMTEEGLSLSDGYDIFSNHIRAGELLNGFRSLESFGLVEAVSKPTGGRPLTRWVPISRLAGEGSE